MVRHLTSTAAYSQLTNTIEASRASGNAPRYAERLSGTGYRLAGGGGERIAIDNSAFCTFKWHEMRYFVKIVPGGVIEVNLSV